MKLVAIALASGLLQAVISSASPVSIFSRVVDSLFGGEHGCINQRCPGNGTLGEKKENATRHTNDCKHIFYDFLPNNTFPTIHIDDFDDSMPKSPRKSQQKTNSLPCFSELDEMNKEKRILRKKMTFLVDKKKAEYKHLPVAELFRGNQSEKYIILNLRYHAEMNTILEKWIDSSNVLEAKHKNAKSVESAISRFKVQNGEITTICNRELLFTRRAKVDATLLRANSRYKVKIAHRQHSFKKQFFGKNATWFKDDFGVEDI